jgi:hypothetical protein
MSSIVVSGDTSGSVTLSAPAVAGSVTVTLPSATGTMLASGNTLITPQGRLTLVTATPVMTSAQTAKTTIYYTPYVGSTIPIYDGTNWSHARFSELSNITTNSSTGSAGPAATTTNSNYDLFVWLNSGTLTLTRGPAWTSDTARGTGAGTTQLTMTNGIWTNTVAITNGPGAGVGTYVGTVRTDGSSQVNWNPTPSAAAGGGNARVDVFNAYNRIRVDTKSQDSTASWVYNTNTWRSTNNSTSNRINYIDGLGEMSVGVTASISCNPGASNSGIGVNRDSTSATPSSTVSFQANQTAPGHCSDVFQPSIGFHYIQAMESNSTGSTNTFYGASSSATGGQAQTLTAVMVM